MKNDSSLSVTRLCKRFNDVLAVDEISFHVEKGEFMTLLGPSGSGKTTTLLMIAGFLSPTAGRISFRGKNILPIPSYKRNFGMIFQNYALFPHMTVFGNISFPLKMRGIPKRRITEEVRRVLEIVKLPGFEGRYSSQLSGGQQQRIAIARALVYDPSLLLMDEPLGALDKQLREHMQIELRSLQQSLKITSLYVTHDQQEALTMSDRIVVFNEGKIQQIGTPQELYEKPRNLFVADFIGESNFIKGRITALEGEYAVLTTLDKGVTIKCFRSPDLSLNEQSQVVVRPEKVKFFESSDRLPVCLSGVVENVVYAGETIKYSIRISENQTVDIKQQSVYGETFYKKGEHVVIGWSLEDSKIIC